MNELKISERSFRKGLDVARKAIEALKTDHSCDFNAGVNAALGVIDSIKFYDGNGKELYKL